MLDAVSPKTMKIVVFINTFMFFALAGIGAFTYWKVRDTVSDAVVAVETVVERAELAARQAESIMQQARTKLVESAAHIDAASQQAARRAEVAAERAEAQAREASYAAREAAEQGASLLRRLQQAPLSFGRGDAPLVPVEAPRQE